MATYLVMNGSTLSCIESAAKPYIRVGSGYLPLTTSTRTGRQNIVSNNSKSYRVMEVKSSEEYIYNTLVYTTYGYSGTSSFQSTRYNVYTKSSLHCACLLVN